MLARLSLKYKRRYPDAVRLYRSGFAGDPQAAMSWRSGYHRFFAACAAAQAGLGMGEQQSIPADRQAFRQQALEWLRADLQTWKASTALNLIIASTCHQAMRYWLVGRDLQAIRYMSMFRFLPPEENKAWTEFWAEVWALQNRTAPPTAVLTTRSMVR